MSNNSNDDYDQIRGSSSCNDAISRMASALIISASEKAGMEGIDRSKIDAIILRESGNSAYMQQQKRRDDQVNKRIETMLQDLKNKDERSGGGGSDGWRRVVERDLENQIDAHIRNRPTRSACCVFDMDMFYMACELLTRPELKDKPCCVGGGLVTTSNYVARKYGVRSAMAGFIADKLVDELSGGKEKLTHVPSNFALYTEKSHQMRQVLGEYDPSMKSYSLDEACLNIGVYVSLRLQGKEHSDIVKLLIENQKSKDDEKTFEDTGEGSLIDEPLASYPPHVVLEAAAEVVQEMRQRVFEATGGLTCSAGLAPNFMLAKIASDRNKPNGQLVVGPNHEDVLEFLHPLSTRTVGGVGRVTEKMLHALGVTSVRDLYEQRATVQLAFKPATANFLLRTSLGCSSHESQDDDDDDSIGRKGISRERTFASGRSWSEINDNLETIARKLASDMLAKNLWAHTITLKVKLHTFDVMSRARTLARGNYAQGSNELVKISSELLKEVRQQFKGSIFSVRLLGIRCSNFQGEQERLDASQMNIKQYFLNGAEASTTRSTSPNANTRDQQEMATVIATTTSGPAKPVDRQDQVASASAQESILSTKQVVSVAAKVREQVSCPICGKPFDENDNVGLNRHVDVCLNGPVVQAAAKEETMLAQPRKKQRLTDFFAGS